MSRLRSIIVLPCVAALAGCGPGAGPVPWPSNNDLPDLRVSAFSSTPDHFILGDQATVHVTVLNSGRMAAGPFDVEFAVTPHGTRYAWPRGHVAGLAAGASTVVDFVVQVSSPEDVPIEVVVDPDGAVRESSEQNNIFHVVAQVTVPG